MVARGAGGRIVNLASTQAFTPGVGVTYDSSKAAVVQFTRTLALEMAPHGINVNAVAPGGTWVNPGPAPAVTRTAAIDERSAAERYRGGPTAADPHASLGNAGRGWPGRRFPQLSAQRLRHRCYRSGRRRLAAALALWAAQRSQCVMVHGGGIAQMGMLDGKNMVIVGASSGIGRRIVERYVVEGARVVAAARRMSNLEELATQTGCFITHCDATSDDQIQALTRFAEEKLGRIDIAIYCAGHNRGARIADLTPEILQEVAAVQFFGAYYFMRHMCNSMAGTGGGVMMPVTSSTAITPGEGLAAYSGCKAGINFVVQIAALEYGPSNVRVNALAPTYVPTEINNFGSPATDLAFAEETPLGRIMTVDDCADVAILLGSDLSRSMTGQVVPVDGGNSLLRLPGRKRTAEIATRLQAAAGL